MNKIYQQDNMTIHNADCMEVMKNYEDNYFDLAVVDPPYGIDEDGMKKRTSPSRPNSYDNYKKHKKKNWDKSPEGSDYFVELLRVCRNVIIFGANHFIESIPRANSSCWIVWDKKNGDSDFADCELAWTNMDTAVRRFEIHKFNNTRGGKDCIHPCQKPVKLYNWIYANYAKEGQKILDTHLGSGSNAIAAHYAKMEFVGCELDEDYYKAACERIRKETRQQEFNF
jgi:site-specific DNA-methyltransferase (adenine-specific)